MSIDIAIVGMACRVPGASNLAQLWNLITQADISLQTVPHTSIQMLPGRQAVAVRGILDHATAFDYQLFGMSEHDAQELDPQQRLFLESVWDALVISGHHPAQFSGPISLYCASSRSLVGGTLSPFEALPS